MPWSIWRIIGLLTPTEMVPRQEWVLLDFRKAFHLIDHSVLVQKLTTYVIPSQVKGWIVDFLMDRKQRVKLAQDCHSEWRSVPSGVPKEQN